MSAYHRLGPGRPPFNPLGLFRFKIVLFLKGYRSQRALEREVRVDSRVRRLCGFDENVPSHSTIVARAFMFVVSLKAVEGLYTEFVVEDSTR